MNIPPSGREMADIAIANGAIDMAQGVVHTPPPRLFLDILSKLYSERRLHIYASPAGYKPYREAILDDLRKERANLTIDSIMATNGVTGGLISALRAIGKPLDHVLLLEPFYPAHDWAIQAIHCVSEYIPYGNNFSLNLDTIHKALQNKNVSAFLLGNPANPTGTILTTDELRGIHSLCKQYNVVLIVDEVYKDFIWEGEFTSLLGGVDDLKHLVILRSFSKNMALAGWRAGYAITSPERRANMTHIHDALYVGAPTPPQFVLTEMLKNHRDVMNTFMRDVGNLYRENRTAVTDAFRSYHMEPLPKQGAYYMMVKHNRENDMAAMQELLDKGIATAPGAPFYRPGTQDTGYLRIHFALSEADRAKVVATLAK